jgi:timeless
LQVLRDRLLKENKGKLLTWLQRVLIECCFIKLNLFCSKEELNEANSDNMIKIMEPVAHHCIRKFNMTLSNEKGEKN